MYRIVNKGENIEVHINGLMEDEGCLELASDIKNAGEAGVLPTIFEVSLKELLASGLVLKAEYRGGRVPSITAILPLI